MKRNLPPLQTLPAFHLAAEKLSFTKAAEELSLSQSAISQQIRFLEEQLGVRLFERATRKLVLTEAGRTLQRGVARALSALNESVDQIQRQRSRKQLAVSVLPSFGSKWLVPRLQRFLGNYPDIHVTIVPSTEIVDFSSQRFDLAIRWTEANWPDLTNQELLSDILFPVCSPGLIAKSTSMGDDLIRRGPLIADTTHDNWTQWFTSQYSTTPPEPVATYDNFSDLIQAAIDGQGIALARSPLVLDDLVAGRLFMLSERHLASRRRYVLLYPPWRGSDAVIEAFRSWLLAEAIESNSQIEALFHQSKIHA